MRQFIKMHIALIIMTVCIINNTTITVANDELIFLDEHIQEEKEKTYKELRKSLDNSNIVWLENKQINKKFNTFIDGTPSENKASNYKIIYEQAFDNKVLRKYLREDNSRSVALAYKNSSNNIVIQYNNDIQLENDNNINENSFNINNYMTDTFEIKAYQTIRLNSFISLPLIANRRYYSEYGTNIIDNLLSNKPDYNGVYISKSGIKQYTKVLGEFINKGYKADNVVYENSELIAFISNGMNKHIVKFDINKNMQLEKPTVIM